MQDKGAYGGEDEYSQEVGKVLLNSVVASPALKYRFPMVLNMPEEPLFDVDMIQKDLMLALDT